MMRRHRNRGSIELIVPLLVFLSFLLPVRSGAATSGDLEAKERPALLLVRVGTDAESIAREEGFKRELQLSLDRFQIKVLSSGDGFASSQLPSQLELVREYAGRVSAEMAVWIADTSMNTVTLHLVALGQGRATVRTVEAERGPDTAADLALVVRELVEEVYPESQLQNSAPAKQEEIRIRRWAVLTLFRFNNGMYGQVGPSARFGGTIAAEWWPMQAIFLRTSFVMLAGPSKNSDGEDIFGWGLGPGIGLGYGWYYRQLFFGPFFEIRVPRSTVYMTLGTGDPFDFSWWNLRCSLGLDVRLALTRSLAVVLNVDAGVLAKQVIFRRLSDSDTSLSTPSLDFSASAGVVFTIN